MTKIKIRQIKATDPLPQFFYYLVNEYQSRFPKKGRIRPIHFDPIEF